MFIFGSLIAASCEKEPEPLTTNSAITGSVYIYNSVIRTPYNVRVVASGPYGQKSVITDEANNFIITGLGNGTYYLDYSKEGFGTVRQYGIQLYGSDTAKAYFTGLFEKVNEFYFAPDFISAYQGTKDRSGPSDKIWICIETTIKGGPDAYNLPVMLFLDTDSDVSWEKYTCSRPASNAQFDNDGQHMVYIDPENLPFVSGDEVFLIGYVCNTDEYTAAYLDTYYGVKQYSTLEKNKHSNRVSFIMP